MDFKKIEKRIDKYLDSPEFEQAIHRMIDKRKIMSNQLFRFHEKIGYDDGLLNSFISKVMTKYESESYKQRWFSRGIEPEEGLYWFLLEYAENFGCFCLVDGEIFEEYANSFMHELYEIGSYYIGRMDGQGSCVRIYKK